MSSWFDLPGAGVGQGSVLPPDRLTSSLDSYNTLNTDKLNCDILVGRQRETKSISAHLGLVIEHKKSDLMQFTCTCLTHTQDMQLLLTLGLNQLIRPKTVWQYLGVHLDRSSPSRHMLHTLQSVQIRQSALCSC